MRGTRIRVAATGSRTGLGALGVAVLCAATLCLLPGAATAAPTVSLAAPAGSTLRDVVTARIVQRAGARVDVAGTQVNLLRSVSVPAADLAGGEWVLGTAVAMAPPVEGAYPEGWLFLAGPTDTGRAVAFEGDVDFPRLAAAAPAALLSEVERGLFASHGPAPADVLAKATGPSTRSAVAAGADYRTGMRLPFALGQSWRLTGGPHGGARQSIDLAGGDGRVLAARAGAFYVMCGSGRGWVRVVHDRGYSTDYYHLRNNRTAGGTVDEGTHLGDIGTDVSCGGRATGPHNHFSLRQNSVNVGIAAHSLGKWQVYDGPGEYEGYALHGSTVVGVGGALLNHGPLGPTEAVVDTNGGGILNRRAGPGTGFPVVGTVPDGETVTIACSATGTVHTGRFAHTTDLWNRLADGTWISDAYSWTGTATPLNGWCPPQPDDSTPPASVGPGWNPVGVSGVGVGAGTRKGEPRTTPRR